MTLDPFAQEYLQCLVRQGGREDRLRLAHQFAYVIPEAPLLDVVARYSPIVEIAAGTGYWAHLLRRRGVDVVAYDQAPPSGSISNRYHPDATAWSEVRRGDASDLASHADRALLLCWPPVFSALGSVLDSYRGDTVIYVGDRGPRTAWPRGLQTRYVLVEKHEVMVMDPAPATRPELSVWQTPRRV